MKLKSFILFLLMLQTALVFSQEEKSYIRKGNNAYLDGEFDKAKENYDKAIEKNEKSEEAVFNLGDALYRKQKFAEAASQFESIANSSEDENIKSKAYHNLGNSMLQSKKIEESIAAYKNALKSNPKNEAARYNLAYAQKILKQQQKNDKNKDKKDDKNKDEKDKKKNDENKDKKEGDKKDSDKKNEKDKEKQGNKEEEKNKNKEKGEQPKPQKISKQNAKRLLDALNKQEAKTQQKLNMKKGKGKKVKIEKDW